MKNSGHSRRSPIGSRPTFRLCHFGSRSICKDCVILDRGQLLVFALNSTWRRLMHKFNVGDVVIVNDGLFSGEVHIIEDIFTTENRPMLSFSFNGMTEHIESIHVTPVKSLMDPELKAKWVAALRSGAFNQGHDRMCDNEEGDPEDSNFCCLGVLCKVADFKPVNWR